MQRHKTFISYHHTTKQDGEISLSLKNSLQKYIQIKSNYLSPWN